MLKNMNISIITLDLVLLKRFFLIMKVIWLNCNLRITISLMMKMRDNGCINFLGIMKKILWMNLMKVKN